MSRSGNDVDVAIVGASIAGCAAARLFAQQGLTVALIEKHGDPDSYKRLCGHYIQSSATPVIRRLGLAEGIEAAGGVRNGIDVWTRWGWIKPRHADESRRPHGYSITRSKLDPLIRRLAADTPGVRFLGGNTVVEISDHQRHSATVVVRDRRGSETPVRAALVVGADGRNSAVAKLVGARERKSANERFCYMAYAEGIEHRADQRSWLWMLEPDVAIVSPNEDGITILAAFPHKDRLPAFKRDRQAAFDEFFGRLPDDPGLGARKRVSKFVGYTDYAPIERDPVPGQRVALIGDAALTADPLMAIGCGWAFQSAAWLVDSTSPALRGEESFRRGFRRYRRERRQLAGHARVLNQTARAKPPNPVERLMLSAASRDDRTARLFEGVASRSTPIRRLFSPAALVRAGLVNAR